ncbi:FAD-dependent oxidoreductase [Haladaptatus sp. ZSTT2]|uniref:FAD-dependent oxidoreductase n=1 Tax=Haladaptatus sp. ZSTT2 TaxID=3120515 RepID=UPI00300F66CD
MGATFVVIGGDAAGMSAASKAKRDNPDITVIVFEKGEWVSYAACGMPYYVKGVIPSLSDLVQVTAEEFRTERDIDLRTGHEVVGINPDSKTVSVSASGKQFEQSYDYLLIGTGARAIEPPFDGMDLDGVFTIHDLNAADAIHDYVEQTDTATAAIVGGGYVGIEMAEALATRGLSVHLFEMLSHVLQPFGESVSPIIESHLESKGVELHLDTPVSGFVGDEIVESVELEAEMVPADIVIVGVGVTPNVELADAAGIELGETGAIATDEYGRTNYDEIFAAGDCAETTNVVTAAPDYVPLALTANRVGRAIGQTIAGTPTKIGTTAGTAIVKAFDLGAARTGILDETVARTAGFDPVSVEITAPSRAHYYPGAEDLTVTLVADKQSGRVLGGSVVGREGVKRIDTVATAVHAELTVAELQQLDLAYAPPFSPVWDPILSAARVLSGSIEKSG